MFFRTKEVARQQKIQDEKEKRHAIEVKRLQDKINELELINKKEKDSYGQTIKEIHSDQERWRASQEEQWRASQDAKSAEYNALLDQERKERTEQQKELGQQLEETKLKHEKDIREHEIQIRNLEAEKNRLESELAKTTPQFRNKLAQQLAPKEKNFKLQQQADISNTKTTTNTPDNKGCKFKVLY